MLILVPPSESKRPPAASGDPVDIESLSFPELEPTRRRVAEALIATSARQDAFERLHVGPSKAEDVARNTWLLELPAMPVVELYTGPLHVGLDYAHLPPDARERAQTSVVILSALWGALRPSDRIPPYRLRLWSSLVGIERLDQLWRAVLPGVLSEAAGDGLVVDLRSPESQQAGSANRRGDRMVVLRIDPGRPGRHVGDVVAKRTRGEAAHYLLESGSDPRDLSELAELLGKRWPIAIDPPERDGKPWRLTLGLDA